DLWMTPSEYLLADKGYQLDRHVITPYKGDAARAPANRRFNDYHAVKRVKIEYAFGVLKGRWHSLRGLSIRINTSEEDHERVTKWITACIVLHNMLA
ncbi:hypothetical protein L211DRAFT_757398, partial [Terfezia boudieri ATCC MYA-4762]